MLDLPDYPLVSERVNHPLIPAIAARRLNNFFQGDYATQNVSALLDKARTDAEEHVSMTCWSAEGMDKPTFQEGIHGLSSNSAKAIRKGHAFGPSWSNHWVRVELNIPEAFRHFGQEVLFDFDPSCEALIFTEEGHAVHGLTGTAKRLHPGRQATLRTEHIIPQDALKAGRYKFYIEVSANGLFGAGLNGLGWAPPDMKMTFQLLKADIVLPNQDVRNMHTDFRILQQISQSTENRASELPRRAMKAANEMMDAWQRVPGDTEDPSLLLPAVEKCREIAWEVLGPLNEKDKAALVPTDPDAQSEGRIWFIGHCHIDTAWLWRYSQTQQKVARSWTTQCDLMDRWSNHQFAASSAQQYLWLEKYYPDAFERVKSYVKAGRFHPVGGAWLEHDSNMPCGESLVRQCLYGQRYFKSRFGAFCREAWLPDTFGYACQLPQIFRQTGMKYFFTQKLSWNNITVFPYTTFNWAGIDGSQVTAHLAPTDTYNAQCNFPELEKSLWNNKNIADAPESLLLFGNGDGGGGPTPDMLEKLERLSSLAIKHGEVPPIKIGKPADFFDRILKITRGGQTLPTWRGELYLEFHRGTYTTQANIKKGNRTMERLLRNLEYFATMAMVRDKSYEYPRTELAEMWQDTMLNQFHDVLPGTTISMVVDDVLDIYRRRITQAEGLIENALSVLYPGSKVLSSGQMAPEEKVFVIDPLRLAREEVTVFGNQKGSLAISTKTDGSGRITSTTVSGARASKSGDDSYLLENDDFRMTLRGGRITSLVDVPLARELILAGPGADSGGLMIYEDYPIEWDAWDVEVYHLNSYEALRFQQVEAGEEKSRAYLKATCNFGKSKGIVTFSLGAARSESDPCERSLIRMDMRFDWHEEHKVVKFVLPLDLHCPHATFGTQFGLIERPTHRNTPYDQAKFEVCGHMFGDLSETGYGVALSSDHKYGYAVEGNVIRMSLLRAPKSPDATADIGEHEFSLAILPHVGYLQGSNTFKHAMGFTNPVYLRSSNLDAKPLPSFVVEGLQARSLILETIKTAEDSEAVILRLYEALGGKSQGHLAVSGVKVKSARWANLLEEPLEDATIKHDGGVAQIALNFRAFEIRTLMLELA